MFAVYSILAVINFIGVCVQFYNGHPVFAGFSIAACIVYVVRAVEEVEEV